MLKYAETHLASLVVASWDTLCEKPAKQADPEGFELGCPEARRREAASQELQRSDESDSSSFSSDDYSSDSDAEAGLGTEPQPVDAADAGGRGEPDGGELAAAGAQRGLGEAGPQRASEHTVLAALEGLKLDGTSCLEALRLAFQVSCLRCTQSAEVVFGAVEVAEASERKVPTLAASLACARCNQDMAVSVAPHLVHAASNALAHMRVAGCVPVDLLPCWFGAQCDECGALAAVRHVQVCARCEL